jgi:hypothetical protein
VNTPLVPSPLAVVPLIACPGRPGPRTGRRTTLSTLLVLGLMVGMLPDGASASIAYYVGKNLTADGSVLLGGYGDEPSSHWLEIVPPREVAPGTMLEVGVTAEARYPGERFEIPQVSRTFGYIATFYSEFAGFPAPLTNGGLNERLVAARDVWSPSREELRAMTPRPQRGLSYSDLSRIVMERATSARHAVEIVGELIDQHGYATYGGNSHLFADAQEGWVLIEFAGGQGLWVAERLGPDDIRVSYPGYILEIPLDYQQHPNYLGSDNVIRFAVEQGWYDPDSGEPFDVNRIYGDGQGRSDLAQRFEQQLRAWAPNVTLANMMGIVRNTDAVRDSSGYGQVVSLHADLDQPELATLWVAATSPVAAPFLPYRLGVREVPPEFMRHRYLTAGEAARFQDPDTRGLESTRYAFQVFKRLYYLVMEHPDRFLGEVVEAWEALEARLIREQDEVGRTARVLYEAGEADLARRYLTRYSMTESLQALDVGDALARSVDARTKLLHGTRLPARRD